MPEMAMPTPRATRPDKCRDPASLLPTHFVLGVSLPLPKPTQMFHPAFVGACRCPTLVLDKKIEH